MPLGRFQQSPLKEQDYARSLKGPVKTPDAYMPGANRWGSGALNSLGVLQESPSGWIEVFTVRSNYT